jgi:phage-related protein
MPATRVVFYQEADGKVPVRDWLDELRNRNRRAFEKCIARLQWLRDFGHELRRPTADYLRDGIWELRIGHRTVNYRILYFFYKGGACVLAHGLTKTDVVPDRDIERALRRKMRFEQDPEGHSYER